MHIFDVAWALLLIPAGGVGASYLAETRRGAALMVVASTWLTLGAALVVLGATVAAAPRVHQSTLTFWTFPVTQTPFNSASSTLLSPNFQVGVGYSATPVAVVLALVVVLAVLLGQTQLMSQLRSDARLAGLMRSTGLLSFAAVALVMAPGFFQVLLGFEICGVVAALLVGSAQAASAGRSAWRTYLGWRVGGLSLLLAIVFLYVKFSGAIEVAATSARRGTALSALGLNFSALESVWTAAAHGQVHGVGGRTLTLAAVLILIAIVAASGLLPLQGLWRGLGGAPGASAGIVLAVVGVAVGAALAAQAHTLLALGSAVLPVLTVLASLTAVLMAVLALREMHLRRFAALAAASLSGTVLIGFGLDSVAAAIAMAVSSVLTVSVLAGATAHLSRDLRVDRIQRLGPAWRQARPSVLVLMGAMLATAGVLGVGTFFGRAAILAAAFSGPAHGVPEPLGVVRVVGAAGALLASAILAAACGRVAAAALRGEDPRDPREARATRRHLNQARVGSQVAILRIGVGAALVSGLVSIPATSIGLGPLLAAHRGATALPFDWIALGLTLVVPLLAGGLTLRGSPVVEGGPLSEATWIPWADGSQLLQRVERLAVGWPSWAVEMVTLHVLDPLADAAAEALLEASDLDASERQGWQGWSLRSGAATLAVVVIAVGILAWVGAAHPGAVGAP